MIMCQNDLRYKWQLYEQWLNRNLRVGNNINHITKMQVLQISFMKAVIYLLAPSSPAFGNTKNPFFAKEQYDKNSIDIQLQPTDIIFTRTDTLIYNGSRSFLGIEYDHVAVVINNHQLLHISPPIVSRLPISSLLNKTRYPLVVRPTLNDQEKQTFLIHLLNLLGTKYSMSSIPQIFLHEVMNKLNVPQSIQWNLQKLKDSRICSDAIVYALCKSSQQFQEQFNQQITQTQYNKLGFVLPDDFLQILRKNYQIIYQQQQKPFHKPILQIAQQKLSSLYENTKQNAATYLIIAKVMSLLKSNTSLLTQANMMKTIIFKNVKIISLAMLLCDLLGIATDSVDYSRKLMILTSLMTIVGSGLWVGTEKEMKYEIPDAKQLEKLFTAQIKPKL